MGRRGCAERLPAGGSQRGTGTERRAAGAGVLLSRPAGTPAQPVPARRARLAGVARLARRGRAGRMASGGQSGPGADHRHPNHHANRHRAHRHPHTDPHTNGDHHARGMMSTSSTDPTLQKKVEQLAILQKVGQALRASLELDNLLPVLQEQVTRVLGVENFYVALLRQEGEELWYPLAVKEGKRQNWPPRPLADRLTDRVIRESRIITVTPRTQSGEHPIGMPPGESQPKSWLGVPLITPERTIGCLAVFNLRQGVEFDSEDIELLTLLADQISVAVDNALLYTQIRQRAQKLERLSQAAARMAASLNLLDVLRQICQAVSEVSAGAACSLFLFEGPEERRPLACSEGLPAALEHFPQDENHPRAVRLSRREMQIYPRLETCDWPQNDIAVCRQAGFQACVDIPLVAQRGVIGVLSVFYRQAGPPPADEQRMLTTLAAQAALSIENARLFMHTDAQLFQRVRQLDALIDSVAEGILMLDPQGVIHLANRVIARLLDLPAARIADTHLTRLQQENLAVLGFRWAEEAQLLLEALQAGEMPENLDQPYTITRQGEEKVFTRAAHPVIGRDGRALGWLLVWRDISEEYRLNRERQAIADALVHDLRSPISAVLGSLDLLEGVLRDTLEEDQELVFRSIQVARRSARRVLRMVRSLLDVTRMEAGRLELEFAPLDLAALIKIVVQENSVLAAEFDIRLETHVQPDLPLIRGDEEKLLRVLVNLVDNAIKFSPSNTTIQILARQIEEQVEVRVRDQGPGIPPEQREKIFERYASLEGRRGRWRGAGLGLSFCKLTIEAHGGAIWVETPAEGQGSEFVFRLPLWSNAGGQSDPTMKESHTR
ncbi:MAG: GAF domain-containing protein [Anaerolineae bacterium]|nr:MAG: GAF domain-containing protein [Anaerolineae bacterium]